MRGALIISLLLILFTPACSATQPIVPAVTITLQPSTVNVTTTVTQKDSAEFNGNVTMDKLPVVRIVVSLTPSVDKGWASSCSPSSIVIIDESPHSFSCTVVVPENTPNSTGTLTVEAVARGGGFSVTQSATAIIVVTGPPIYVAPPHNQTQNPTSQNQTPPNRTASPVSEPWSIDATSLSLLTVVIVAAAGSGTYAVYRRRKVR